MRDSTRAALAQFKLANLWQRRGEAARALDGYARAIELDARCVPAHLERGDLLMRQGEREAAIKAYQRGLEANPNDASLQTHLANAVAQGTIGSGEETYIGTASATANGNGSIVLISDGGGVYGAAQVNQLLMEGLEAGGYPFVNAPKLISTSVRRVLEGANPALVIFSDGTPLSNLAAKQVVRERGIPYIVLVHGTPAQHAHVEEMARLAELYRAARAVIAVSCRNLEILRRDFGLAATQGQVIYNACPAIYFAPRSEAVRRRVRGELGIPQGAVLGLTAARMELGKGYQYQLGALKQLRSSVAWSSLYVAWAGSGTLEPQLRAEVMEQGMEEQVRFLGERTDMPALLDASDLFILTSEHEGMPRAIIEALAKGLPVAATAVDGVPEALGSTGQLLANPNTDAQATLQELVETLEGWIADSTRRAKVGRACRERAVELFQPIRMQEDYLAVIQDARR